MNDSTPRTNSKTFDYFTFDDAIIQRDYSVYGDGACVEADFARQLERELYEALDALIQLRAGYVPNNQEYPEVANADRVLKKHNIE